MHEMGEVKRAQELRVDEVSVQKLREKHETIQKLTSQLQQMQEQMNFINCLLTHGTHRDYRKTFLVINFLRLIHPDIIIKKFSLATPRENEDQFHKLQG